jgi:hypothetical protein
VKILETGEDGLSAPNHVLKRLDDFTDEFELGDEDELWLVVDTDRFSLQLVTQQATQKNYLLAVSNPCFEVWLLLHASDFPADLTTCQEFKREIRRVLGSYNHTNLQVEDFHSGVQDAIRRATCRNPDPAERWPPTVGTHVYRLVESLTLALK